MFVVLALAMALFVFVMGASGVFAPGSGVLAIVSAAALPLVGYERFRRVIEWWTGHSPLVMRLWSLVAVGLGGVVLWSLT